MQEKDKASPTRITIPLIFSAILLSMMIFTFSACQAVATESNQLPRLLAVLEDPAPWAWPEEIVIHPNGYAYVTLDTGEVVVLDGPEFVATIPRPELEPHAETIESHLAVHPVTEHVYWTDNTGYVHVISDTKVITSIVGVEHLPQAIAIHPDTGLVYVANAKRRGWPENQTLPSNVTVISGTQIITDLIVGYVPSQLAVSPVDKRIYVAQNLGVSYFEQELLGMLGIIDGMQVITNTNLEIGEDADSILNIAINPNDGNLYLSWRNILLYWDRENAPIKVPIDYEVYGHGFMRDIKVNATNDLAYISYWGSDKSGVSVVQGSEVIAQLLLSGEPRKIAIDTTHNYVYVANYQNGELSVIRGTEVITTLDTGGSGSWDIGVDEERGYIYVSNADSHSISVFGFEEETSSPSLWETFFPVIGK